MARLAAAMSILVLVGAVGASTEETRMEFADQVRAAETAFALSMAERDLDGFLSHIAEEAVFFGEDGAMRGLAEVKNGWSPYFEDAEAPFSWRPEVVEVLDSGWLALSSGPVFGPNGKQVGTFNSIWRRDADDRWRVVFDKGSPVYEEE